MTIDDTNEDVLVGSDDASKRSGTEPTVDVVIPCYNYGHFLPRCVASVLDQPDVSVRVLVIDDTSTDRSADVARNLADTDDRVEARVHEVNKGHIATYNEGLLGWAEADYTVLLSADDLLVPGSLGRATKIMESDPDVGFVYGRSAYFVDENELPRVPTKQRGVTVWDGWDWIRDRCRSTTNVISSPEVVARTSVQHQVGGYRPELAHAGDLEMWLRLAAVANVGYVRGIPQAYYRVHDKSMMRTQWSDPLADVQQRREVFDAFFDEYGATAPDLTDLRRLVGRALAREVLWNAARAYDRDALDQVPVDEMEAFALEVFPAAKSLPEYRALLRRRRLGPELCRRTQLFAPSALARKAERRYRLERWKRTGT